jgi:hypothetical protein
MTNQMHPAKALQTAVFAIGQVTYTPANIRHTDITVYLKFGNYFINNAGTQYRFFDRNDAISKLQQLLIDGRN